MTFRGATAVAGIAELHHPRGKAPAGERVLTLEAILAARRDAGISPRDIDGFTSYAGGQLNGPQLAADLGIRELRWSTMVWGGGGGGEAATSGAAAPAVAPGHAVCGFAQLGRARGRGRGG